MKTKLLSDLLLEFLKGKEYILEIHTHNIGEVKEPKINIKTVGPRRAKLSIVVDAEYLVELRGDIGIHRYYLDDYRIEETLKNLFNKRKLYIKLNFVPYVNK